jgi:hypothetical protein
MAGLALCPTGTTRFEMNVSFGLWKPQVGAMGIRATSRK